MRILIINGSHREGNTDIAVKFLVEELRVKGFRVKELILRNIEMKLPDGCKDCAESEYCPNIKDEFALKIEPRIHNFDIYIIATPTWDDGVTPLTKIFWDRIVAWSHDDRKYLKNKKLAVITHGMAGPKSWKNVIDWVKSVCSWEECKFGGVLTFRSGSGVGDIKIKLKEIDHFISRILFM
jgi:multimeric flavodoxin WrbA